MNEPVSYKRFHALLSSRVSFVGEEAKEQKEILGGILKDLGETEDERFKILKQAARATGLSENAVSDHLPKSFRDGKGSSRVAWALYYYLHKEYAPSENLNILDCRLIGEPFAEFAEMHVDGRPYMGKPSRAKDIIETGTGVSERSNRLPSGSLPLHKSVPTVGHWVSSWYFRALAATLAAITFTSLFFLYEPMRLTVPSEGTFSLKIWTLDNNKTRGISPVSNEHLFLDSDAVQFEALLDSSSHPLAIALYRRVSSKGGLELVEIFRADAGINFSNPISVGEIVSLGVKGFAIVTSGCSELDCSGAFSSFPENMLFPEGLKNLLGRAEIDLSNDPQFWVELNVIEGAE